LEEGAGCKDKVLAEEGISIETFFSIGKEEKADLLWSAIIFCLLVFLLIVDTISQASVDIKPTNSLK